jgi:cytochrome P450
MQECALGHYAVRRGALIMVSPWTMHRHREYWQQPDAFDPDRFMPGREESLTPGAYLPFGLGPRVCVGAAFAMTESSLILAEWVRRYDWTIIKPDPIRPAARLTTRPALPVWLQLRRHE